MEQNIKRDNGTKIRIKKTALMATIFIAVGVFSATMIWWLWPFVMTTFFPALVDNGTLAAEPGWWACFGFFVLFSAISGAFKRKVSRATEKKMEQVETQEQWNEWWNK